ncbi:MAG TPA: hypothetical protein VJ927_05045 [Actinomycetota bacterium]|nr:hypothetical protein [Actinomycetota bacterium]
MTANMDDIKLLRIYLNDHLAGSVAGYELAKRTQSNNEGTPLGDYLIGFMQELREDQAAVERLLDSIDATPDRLKQMAAWIAEKAGRVKLNGQITGYSDLSRLLELEGLCLGVEGKLSLWRSLMQVAGHHPMLAVTELDDLIARAGSQREKLEEFRLGAAAVAFGAAL